MMRKLPSIRTKFLAAVLFTTFCALLVAGSFILLYDVTVYRILRTNDMTAQVETLAFSTAPALQFEDAAAARETLNFLHIRPSVQAAAIYSANGRLFASYTRNDTDFDFPVLPESESTTIANGEMKIFHRIISNGEILGTAFIQADYLLRQRIINFLSVLALVALGAMMVAILVSFWLQSFITRPVLSIVEVARDVVTRKDYSRRAEQQTQDEVGILVEAFNDMLNEIESRTSALENTNRELEQEVSERKRAREEVLRLNEELKGKVEELKEADRHKDDFLATLAHELRNPLAPIRSGLDLLRKADESKKQDIIGILDRQTQQLIRLVDELLDVSRISRGKVSLHKQVVSLREVLQGAMEATQGLMEQKQHHFEVELPEPPVLLYGDSVRLTQVFLNLLSNAAHYTNDGGTIGLGVKLEADVVEVGIQDNGIGMSREMLSKSFEAFVQIENSLTATKSGLGIGLTLARSLVRMHGGAIHAHSEGLGKGTEFVVRLPLATPEQRREQPTTVESPGRQTQHRILVVDDNEDAADTLGMLLTLEDQEVKVVYSGEAALEAGREFAPQVILLDLGMPGMSGVETAEAVRRTEWGRDIALVAVTGWGQDRHRTETRQGGFDLHLVKPITPEQLEPLLSGKKVSGKELDDKKSLQATDKS